MLDLKQSEFKYFKKSYAESMEKMFTAVSDLYAKYWDEFFHFAIYKNPNQNREKAFEETHEKYFKALKLNQAKNVLEIACGRGSMTNLMAQRTKGCVLGIDISRSQLSHAKEFERANLSFKHHDVMKLTELKQTFDAIICMDAACYFPDKRKAVKAISKVLRPGGRFVLVDWCKKEGLNTLQERTVLLPFMKAWAIAELETTSNYQKYFKEAGLKQLEFEDLNSVTEPNWNIGYENAITAAQELSYADLPGLIWTGLKIGPQGIKLIQDQFEAALYIKAGFDAGFLRYSYFMLEKI
jgi:cyclopropane fatty-acyl-phospholipid synthase-like methyltransferase